MGKKFPFLQNLCAALVYFKPLIDFKSGDYKTLLKKENPNIQIYYLETACQPALKKSQMIFKTRSPHKFNYVGM
jgi:hypothetical protein